MVSLDDGPATPRHRRAAKFRGYNPVIRQFLAIVALLIAELTPARAQVISSPIGVNVMFWVSALTPDAESCVATLNFQNTGPYYLRHLAVNVEFYQDGILLQGTEVDAGRVASGTIEAANIVVGAHCGRIGSFRIAGISDCDLAQSAPDVTGYCQNVSIQGGVLPAMGY